MLVQFLHNKEGTLSINYLMQSADIPDGEWYTEDIRWAATMGIVTGYGLLGLNDNITREQLAVMFWRYAGNPAATDKELHFTDAGDAGGYALGSGKQYSKWLR